jgi:hypothetical protein
VQACHLLGLSLSDLPDLFVDVIVVISSDGEFFCRDCLLFRRRKSLLKVLG